MKPLLTNQKMLTWMCICPADDTRPAWIKCMYVALSSAVIAIEVSGLCSSAVYFLKNVSSDLDAALFAFLQMFALSGTVYTFIVALVIRHKIHDTFKTLTNIYDTNTEKDSFRFLARANNKCESIWQMFIKFGMIGIAFIFVMLCTVSILISWLMHGILDDTNYFGRPYQLCLPWNQQTLFGYILEMVFSVLLAESYFLIHGTFSLMFISFCFNHQAFYEQFQYSLQNMANENRNDRKELRELIRSHCTHKNFLLSSAKVFSPYIMIQLMCTMLVLACTIFQLDLQTNHLDSKIFILFISTLSTTLQMFVYCYFGKLASGSYEKMTNRLYESNWHERPVVLQKHFVLMIQNAQIPVHYHGFGFAVLDLELFTKLMKAVSTYYMILKTITSK